MKEQQESGAVRIALIVGSTRPNRFADVPVRWMLDAAEARSDLSVEVLDLRDWALPFYEAPMSLPGTGHVYSNPVVERWRRTIDGFDGFIATAVEYNHGPTAVLKNALDWSHFEWNNKPIAFVGYGGVGGARAVEQLRSIAIELQMAPIKQAVHIGLEPYLGVVRDGKTLDDYPFLAQSRTATLDQLVWWARALKSARAVSGLEESVAA
jgi:NAD(P)H-dependent FMN reductase